MIETVLIGPIQVVPAGEDEKELRFIVGSEHVCRAPLTAEAAADVAQWLLLSNPEVIAEIERRNEIQRQEIRREALNSALELPPSASRGDRRKSRGPG